ncbi:MAG: zinc-ribbon domain-containing protein, partial [Gemmatimonadota bacterium]|nr:zinc-ribbon domain-containing protein [Gemmatimonadota bacterium]
MNVTCPNCATVYRVDPAKVPEAGVRARCAVCSAVFAVTTAPSQPPPAVQPARAESPRPEPPRAELPRRE